MRNGDTSTQFVHTLDDWLNIVSPTLYEIHVHMMQQRSKIFKIDALSQLSSYRDQGVFPTVHFEVVQAHRAEQLCLATEVQALPAFWIFPIVRRSSSCRSPRGHARMRSCDGTHTQTDMTNARTWSASAVCETSAGDETSTTDIPESSVATLTHGQIVRILDGREETRQCLEMKVSKTTQTMLNHENDHNYISNI